MGGGLLLLSPRGLQESSRHRPFSVALESHFSVAYQIVTAELKKAQQDTNRIEFVSPPPLFPLPTSFVQQRVKSCNLLVPNPRPSPSLFVHLLVESVAQTVS
jgi:hypothetical protein